MHKKITSIYSFFKRQLNYNDPLFMRNHAPKPTLNTAAIEWKPQKTSSFFQIHFPLSLKRFKMGVVTSRFKYSLSWPTHFSYEIPSAKVFFQIWFWVCGSRQGKSGWLPVFVRWRLKISALNINYIIYVCRRVPFSGALCAWTLTPKSRSRNKQMSKWTQADWQLLRARSQITR